jgi:hypothetical protein
VPAERKVAGVEVLRTEMASPFSITDDKVSFTIRGMLDDEVAAIRAV